MGRGRLTFILLMALMLNSAPRRALARLGLNKKGIRNGK
jgi:hypothetical protein